MIPTQNAWNNRNRRTLTIRTISDVNRKNCKNRKIWLLEATWLSGWIFEHFRHFVPLFGSPALFFGIELENLFPTFFYNVFGLTKTRVRPVIANPYIPVKICRSIDQNPKSQIWLPGWSSGPAMLGILDFPPHRWSLELFSEKLRAELENRFPTFS